MTMLPYSGASRVGFAARFAALPLTHPAPAETGCYAIKAQDCSSVPWSRVPGDTAENGTLGGRR